MSQLMCLIRDRLMNQLMSQSVRTYMVVLKR
jgi:hypothetical protein